MSTLDPTLALDIDSRTLQVGLVGVLIIGGLLIWKLIDSVRSVAEMRERESTRREMAAYVAEGSMTPETAERLLGTSVQPQSWEQRIGDLLNEGSIDAEEAERLLRVGPKGSEHAGKGAGRDGARTPGPDPTA